MSLRNADERHASLVLLQRDESEARKHLKKLIIDSANYDEKPLEELTIFCNKFIEACGDFEKKSVALVDHHTRHRNIEEGNLLRKFRYKTLYKEGQEAVNFLNEWLVKYDQEPIDDLASVISHPSLFSIAPTQKKLAEKFDMLGIDDTNLPAASRDVSIQRVPSEVEGNPESNAGPVKTASRGQVRQDTGSIENFQNRTVQRSMNAAFSSLVPGVDDGQLAQRCQDLANRSLPAVPYNIVSARLTRDVSSVPENYRIPISTTLPIVNPIPVQGANGAAQPPTALHQQPPPTLQNQQPTQLPQQSPQLPNQGSYHPGNNPPNYRAFNPGVNVTYPARTYPQNRNVNLPGPHQSRHPGNIPQWLPRGQTIPPPGFQNVPTFQNPTYAQPQVYAQPQFPNSFQLDGSTAYRLRCELLGGLGDPFGGQPKFYMQWYSTLTRRISECGPLCDSLDTINIIIANTSGDVKDLAKNLLSAGIADPDNTLQRIWAAIAERYGSTDDICESILKQLRSLKPVTNVLDVKSLRRIFDICSIAESYMLSNRELRVLNTRTGLMDILDLLPEKIRNSWHTRRFNHKENTGLEPEFADFVDFLSYQCRFFGAQVPSLTLVGSKPSRSVSNSGHIKPHLKAHATKVDVPHSSEHSKSKSTAFCIYHGFSGHMIHECKSFEFKDYDFRKQFAAENYLCYVCLRAECKSTQCEMRSTIKCRVCGLPHITGMHKGIIHKSGTGENSRGGRGGRYGRLSNSRQSTSGSRSDICLQN